MSAATPGVPILVEVGCEEIPHRFLPEMQVELTARLTALLAEQRLGGSGVRAFVGPRRLAIFAEGVLHRQEDREEELIGPPVAAAFKDGKPTPAAEGFARKSGVDVSALGRMHDGKAERVMARRMVEGRSVAEILAEAIPTLFEKLPWPKNMRWGAGVVSWVRPIHWVVAFAGAAPVDVTVLSVRSGTVSRGHRTRSRGPVMITSAANWQAELRAAGVLADRAERHAATVAGLAAKEQELGGRLHDDPALVDAACDLVEWPVVLVGRFPERYLALPAVVLSTAMRHHQKFFALSDKDGALLPAFLHVANQEDPDGRIAANNASVLAARLDDATFFHASDLERPLASRCADLERVLFHEKLGTYAEKVGRMGRLAREAHGLMADAGCKLEDLLEAVKLSKADQTTAVVKEFTELQGVMGGLYLKGEGAPEAVWQAVSEQYLPESTSDRVPGTPAGALLSVVDRVDTLVGCFGVGLVPTGSKDPFGLRRAAQGLLRTLLEAPLDLPLRALLAAAATHHAGAAGFDAARIEADLVPYLEARLRYLLTEALPLGPEGRPFAADETNACIAASWERLPELLARLRALALVRRDRREDFAALAVAFKRVRNIVKGQAPADVEPARLVGPAEKALAARLAEVKGIVDPCRAKGDHEGALAALAGLRPEVDAFFAGVMVMAEDEALRRTRIGLLQEVEALFLLEADVSEIATE